MESASSKSNNYSFTSEDSSALSKVRRLKIEESLLSNTIKAYRDEYEDCIQSHEIDYPEEQSLATIRKSYIDIKNLFEEVKINTIRQEDFKILDIEDVKKDVLELESKIKKIKLFLRSELVSLKANEQELVKKINKIPEETKRLNRRLKIQIKPYNKIVPSPVRCIINSPFKCSEVQQFQEFMSNSKNSCGGWIPYNHNIFKQSWQKYFSIEDEIEIQEEGVDNSDIFTLFVRELLQKIVGISMEDIIAHSKWYSKYTYLKKRQQSALEKWKTNKNLIKKTYPITTPQTVESIKPKPIKLNSNNDNVINLKNENKVIETRISNYVNSNNKKIMQYDDENFPVLAEFKTIQEKPTNIVDNAKCDSDATEYKKLRFLRSTVQWNNKCKSLNDFRLHNNNVENIRRLRIPNWRLILKED